MQTAKQFTRNADNFYLQVELHLDVHPHSLSFLLASTNEEEFYELNLNATPGELRHVLPTLNHFFLYLLKNHNHPKAFRIDPYARIHITVPCTSTKQINVTLNSNRITRDSIVLEDFLLQEEPEVQEVKAPQKDPSQTQILAPFFGKKKKWETCCLDLEEETPRSECVSAPSEKQTKSGEETKKEDNAKREAKNREICRQAEEMLGNGINMREVKKRLHLSDRTAWKMLQQYIKFKRILTPEQTQLIIKNRQAKKLLHQLRQEHPKATAETLSSMLHERGLERSKECIEEWLACNMGSLIYYEQSQSASGLVTPIQ